MEGLLQGLLERFLWFWKTDTRFGEHTLALTLGPKEWTKRMGL
jgi:hypothetical protein